MRFVLSSIVVFAAAGLIEWCHRNVAYWHLAESLPWSIWRVHYAGDCFEWSLAIQYLVAALMLVGIFARRYCTQPILERPVNPAARFFQGIGTIIVVTATVIACYGAWINIDTRFSFDDMLARIGANHRNDSEAQAFFTLLVLLSSLIIVCILLFGRRRLRS